MHRLLELAECGQSYWLDNLTRVMIRGGELRRRVAEEGLRGVTSNPAIFHKAISGSSVYDEQIAQLVEGGASVVELYESLVVTDIQEACDILRTVYQDTDGVDGYVSLEVSPHLIHDTQGTIEEARRLWAAVDRPNLLIKIPGTPAGVPAIEEVLYDGINVNITLLFSVEAYTEVARAYLRALGRRRADGRPLGTVASVASFFLSRIDVLVDQLLSHRGGMKTAAGVRAEDLYGRAAIASARLAYQAYRGIFGGEEWEALVEGGARVQRLLWASTSTKNPLYSPVHYVEPLVGAETVNTMPEVTIEAVSRVGRIAPGTIETGVDEARDLFADLEAIGIDRGAVSRQLIDEGGQKFLDPFDALLAGLAQRRRELLADRATRQVLPAGTPAGVDSTLRALAEQRFSRRLNARDPGLWSAEPEDRRRITDRLGWTRGAAAGDLDAYEIRQFAEQVRGEGVRDVVLLGMGGSSLCPLVLAGVFPSRDGWPGLRVLDDTDPGSVRQVAESIDLSRTLFLVASKSGTTAETDALYRYFFERVSRAVDEFPGRSFVALTDPGSPLLREAQENGFRRSFETPPDVGGRFSALTAFGLLPMALAGVDIDAVLGSARQLQLDSGPPVPEGDSPAVRLGALLALFAREGRNKVTFSASPSLQRLPLWIEQLLAESTGKNGLGIVPVVGEPALPTAAYGQDRLFVHVYLDGDSGAEEERLASLAGAGHPVVRLDLPTRESIGGEFLRWEIATATAGLLLGINPFDEPDVAGSKRNTAELLEAWSAAGRFEEELPKISDGGIDVFLDAERDWSRELRPGSLAQLLGGVADLATAGDYVALLGYFTGSKEREGAIRRVRRLILDRTGVATTFGYGPRYLHSSGQLHKGGPAGAVFFLLTADAAEDLPIPGRPYGFATLQRAQALGDYRALRDRGRRVIRLNLGWYVEEGLKAIGDALSA